jgi:alkylation response protein AidB-like acyl-CoA dehydrogenase
MDLSFGQAYEAYREEVEAFLATQWRADLSPAEVAEFRAEATRRGYLFRAIPRQYGGSEQAPDTIKAVIIREAFARARAPREPRGPGVDMLVPTLVECGSEEQKARFIPPTLRGEYRWCQGYSEPGAGSDLASVKTRAVLTGGEWVISGQKLWTSAAREADYMFALVRTEPAAPKHEGLSYLLLDMQQPGVSVRPLRQITGGSQFNEVFLDEVRTPADWIVGQRGQGWAISKTTLKHERDSIGASDTSERLFQNLVRLARETSRAGRPAIEQDDVRQTLAAIEGYVLAQKFTSYRQLALGAQGRDPGLSVFLNKLLSTEIGHKVALLAEELIGDDALLMPPAERRPGPASHAKWVNQMLGSLGVAIAGGTSNIQRNVIAERGLGLPRESI